jgi:hypothetical protein
VKAELKEKLLRAKELEQAYKKAYESDDFETGRELHIKFLEAQLEVVKNIDEEIEVKKSIPLNVLREKLAREKPPVPKETGILPLDRELVPKDKYNGIRLGGFPLGSFIQLIGSPGSGKTSFFMKMISGFSFGERVSWFNFEMSNRQVIDKISEFDRVEENILYYNSSRELRDIVKEIKYLYADGVRHFVIDSAMKIKSEKLEKVELFSKISSTLKELTSVLNINIYLINQLSQADQKNGVLAIKYGNDAEYDSDFILYMLKPVLAGDNGKPILDEAGQIQYDETKRFIKCAKNRLYERLFTVEVRHGDIFHTNPEVVEYNDNIDLPKI